MATNKPQEKRKLKKTSKSPKTPKSNKSFEIISICLIAFCIYLLACVYLKSGGVVGDKLTYLLLGIMGTGAYILPFVTIIVSAFALKYKNDKAKNKKYIMSYVLLLDIMALLQLMFQNPKDTNEWFLNGANGEVGGGFIGGLLVTIFSVFGSAGAYIITISALMVLVILIFDISLFEQFSKLKAFINAKKESTHKEENKTQAQKPQHVEEKVKPIYDDFNEEKTHDAFDLTKSIGSMEINLYEDGLNGFDDEDKIEETLTEKEKETINREMKEEIGRNDLKDKHIDYVYPAIDLLSRPANAHSGKDREKVLKENAIQLIETLHSFKVDAKVVEISQGPTITRYEIEPAEGVRVNQITNLSKDIGLKFKADKGVMVAPVPGKSTIGIEIENPDPSTVSLREVIESEEFKNHPSKLAVALGKDVSGKTVIMDLAKMPHLLIAGATGAGKSVCINTLIISLLYKADPNEVKLVMIDPKQVELGVYNGIPHLLIPVVKDAKKATGALSWAVQEMTERYSTFEKNNVRNIKGYNDLMEKNGTPEAKMASIVIVIDEFADLMMVAPADVENYVCRIAQLARAAGMHLVIATQRPVVKFITGNIKANVPSRISFMVASVRDSQTILDMGGAEKLIGKGDMLYMPVGETSPSRMQCAFVSDDDVKRVVEAVSKDIEISYDANVMEALEKDEGEYNPDGPSAGDCDELLFDAIDMAVTSGQISTSLLQRRFRIGYNRAGSIIDQMEARGIISGLDGNKPRQVLITREQYNEMLMK